MSSGCDAMPCSGVRGDPPLLPPPFETRGHLDRSPRPLRHAAAGDEAPLPPSAPCGAPPVAVAAAATAPAACASWGWV